ncbi:MAG: phage holin, partial [Clostridia bacterium]
MKWEDLSKYSSAIARLFILVITWINQICTMAEYPLIPIDNEILTTFISTGCTLLATAVCYWKNNSFSTPAVAADNIKKAMKKLTTEKLYALLGILE